MSKRGAPSDDGAAVAETERKVANAPLAPAALGTPEEAPLGSWASDSGSCRVYRDPITSRLSYEESIGEGRRLHGWLDKVAGKDALWQGSLALLEAGKGPWYGPSFGPPPETVGDIQVRRLAGEKDSAEMETQIRVKDEDTDWQPAVRFRLAAAGAAAAPPEAKIEWSDGKVKGGEDEEKEAGDKKRVRT
eukprot:TRINITY_DN48427_c0_g1_i1.p1 TRINITY_DN48427_c0_g1~~TRINITY_DN48427_c0_g1_i1.p1  ORF type:complete len:190 (-),score=42.63 TRINITY_DN48427_c0_g1_i1:138-707(-)